MVEGTGSPYDQPGFARPGSNRSLGAGIADPDQDLPEYSLKEITRIDFDLTLARNLEEIEVSGTVIWVGKTSSDTADIDVTFDKASNEDIPFKRGSYLSGVPFNKIFVSNLAQAAVTITLLIATDRPGDRIDAAASF